MKHTGTCWKCATSLEASDYTRGSSCNHCGLDTRVCRNCIFFDAHAHNQCRENQADRVVEKERSNFCDYFDPTTRAGAQPDFSRDAARSAAEALFRKKS